MHHTLMPAQSFPYATLVHYGYRCATVRKEDSSSDRSEILDQWNDPESGLEVFVANVQSMSTGVNLHIIVQHHGQISSCQRPTIFILYSSYRDLSHPSFELAHREPSGLRTGHCLLGSQGLLSEIKQYR
ncbi:hypothetical protein DER45DRAFT_575801 [Fusarium avenaceum]|nr:hypothetical protein DER45DRAFT_575801 [Fusarium avenaceum]